MNKNKEINREHSRSVLTESNIQWESFNNDNHWKIGKIDFFPTTLKWIDGDDRGEGVMQLVEHMRNKYPMRVYKILSEKLSVDQMFDIVKKVKPMNLYSVCEAIHKEIYR